MEKTKREIISFNEDEMDDFSGTGPWKINGETYEYVTKYPVEYCDGEGTEVVVKRKSDSKYFIYCWSYYHDDYFFEPEFEEVKKKIITKEIYVWED